MKNILIEIWLMFWHLKSKILLKYGTYVLSGNKLHTFLFITLFKHSNFIDIHQNVDRLFLTADWQYYWHWVIFEYSATYVGFKFRYDKQRHTNIKSYTKLLYDIVGTDFFRRIFDSNSTMPETF